MTTHQAIKQMCAWNDVLVPALGEVVVEQETNKIKIGDGKTNFANLPYIDGNPPEPQLSIGAKAFIEDHIELLENNDYETFYSLIKTTELAREVSKALFKAGLNPKQHLKKCPRGCESIFYYEGNYDPNEDFMRILKQKGRSLLTWVTTADNSSENWNEYISDYIDEKVENIKKKIDHLQRWTLEEDE